MGSTLALPVALMAPPPRCPSHLKCHPLLPLPVEAQGKVRQLPQPARSRAASFSRKPSELRHTPSPPVPQTRRACPGSPRPGAAQWGPGSAAAGSWGPRPHITTQDWVSRAAREIGPLWSWRARQSPAHHALGTSSPPPLPPPPPTPRLQMRAPTSSPRPSQQEPRPPGPGLVASERGSGGDRLEERSPLSPLAAPAPAPQTHSAGSAPRPAESSRAGCRAGGGGGGGSSAEGAQARALREL